MSESLGRSAGRSSRNPTRNAARQRLSISEREEVRHIDDDPEDWDNAMHNDPSRPANNDVKRILIYVGLFFGGNFIAHTNPVLITVGVIIMSLSVLGIVKGWGR